MTVSGFLTTGMYLTHRHFDKIIYMCNINMLVCFIKTVCFKKSGVLSLTHFKISQQTNSRGYVTMKKSKKAEATWLKRELAVLKKKLAKSGNLVNVISRGKHQWQATFDAISEPVMIITKDHKIVRANLALAKVADKDIRSVIGKKCHVIFAGRRSCCEGCPLLDAFKNGKPRNSRLEGNIGGRDYAVQAYPFNDEVDRKKSAVVHYRDVTEEKRLQQELIQQEKMAAIGMLAGGVAHEINNPLGGIIAFAQLIKRDLNEGDPLRSDIEEIERAAMRCKKIVQDLLDFSRLSSGKRKQPLCLNPLIEKVIPFIRTELKSLNVELETAFQRNLSPVFGDANRLEQVFLNLLTNACHAMKKGGLLKISTFSDPSDSIVCVKVADTGCGIPKESVTKIFDPFFTTKDPGEGTGLGLSISYRIIRDHGGRIDVESKSGKGTAFTVCLPAAREARNQ